MITAPTTFIRPFSTISAGDVAEVGGKNASLGEMYRELAGRGIPVPDGFAVTAAAYRYLLDAAGAWEPLHAVLDGIESAGVAELAERAARARAIVAGAPIPADLREDILRGHAALEREYGPGVSLAVRSSATAEDLPGASFAGQHATLLNVVGGEAVLAAYRTCLASLFMDRAIHYRIDQGYDHFKVALSVGIMKMVRSDLAASGVAFTLDTESGFRDVVLITGAYGIAENVVQGNVDPDEFFVHKQTFRAGHRAVLHRTLGSKAVKLIFGPGDEGATTVNVPTSDEERARGCISDDEILRLTGMCLEIERHFSERAGRPVPMDIEWAKDGVDGRLYIVQARPETVASQRPATIEHLEEYRLTSAAPAALLRGRAIGTKIASGSARVIRERRELPEFRPGEILVAETTTPDWEPVMKIAAGIVTNRGGRTCHAAIVARELGIPAVIGTGEATSALRTGQPVTLSCAEGETGAIYPGLLPFDVLETDIGSLPPAPVEIMLTLGNPEAAFAASAIPNDGVGLARMEFIIADDIKIHPMALVHPERVDDAEASRTIATLTRAYREPAEYFVQRLSEGVATIAAAFYPKPVIVRMSDFKSNEYARLIGGRAFEPAEENPMLGLRGASRYTHPSYAEGFALECAAMRRVRGEMGFTNVKLMIPFCRRVDEAERVINRMAELGLRRGENGLEVYVMCEIPNNVIQADDFARYFDGFSIGSNDLTQLTLGVDRDSELVAFDYDERDPGVLAFLRQAIEGAKRNRRHIGICGQAPSDYPEMARFLIEAGIDSMSLNPDSVFKTRRALGAQS